MAEGWEGARRRQCTGDALLAGFASWLAGWPHLQVQCRKVRQVRRQGGQASVAHLLALLQVQAAEGQGHMAGQGGRVVGG